MAYLHVRGAYSVDTLEERHIWQEWAFVVANNNNNNNNGQDFGLLPGMRVGGVVGHLGDAAMDESGREQSGQCVLLATSIERDKRP